MARLAPTPRTASLPIRASASKAIAYCHGVPRLSAEEIDGHCVQPAAGIGFEVVHHSLGFSLCCNYRVHVIASNMCCEQLPSAQFAHLNNGLEHRVASDLIEMVRPLIHAISLGGDEFGVWVDDWRATYRVPTID